MKDCCLEFPELHAPDGVVAALLEDEVGAFAGGQDVLAQINEVDGLPQRPRHGRGFVALQLADDLELIGKDVVEEV